MKRNALFAITKYTYLHTYYNAFIHLATKSKAKVVSLHKSFVNEHVALYLTPT